MSEALSLISAAAAIAALSAAQDRTLDASTAARLLTLETSAGAAAAQQATLASDLAGLTASLGSSFSPVGETASLSAWAASVDSETEARLDRERADFEVTPWIARSAVAKGTMRLPSAWYNWDDSTGSIKVAHALNAGRTGDSEPTWPTTDYWDAPTTSDVVDGEVTWRCFSIYCVANSTAAGVKANNAGNGSQLDPYSDVRAITLASAAQRDGRVIALRRGTRISQYSVNTSRIEMRRTAADLALSPNRAAYRRAIIGYGYGAPPVVVSEPIFGSVIRVTDSTTSANHGGITIQDVDVDGSPGLLAGGGSGIYADVAASDLSQRGKLWTELKLFRVRVRGVKPTAGHTVDSGDCNGIFLTGNGNTILDCDIALPWDDGIWATGSQLVVAYCDVREPGQGTLSWPMRIRGDGMQLCSSVGFYGGVRVRDVLVANNTIYRTTAKKHGLIINADAYEATPGGRQRKYPGFRVVNNRVVCITDSGKGTVPAAYLSGFTGEVARNVFITLNGSSDLTTVVHLFAGADFHDNLVVGSGAGAVRGVEPGSVTLNNPDGATTVTTDCGGAQVRHNTIALRVTASGAAASRAVLNWGVNCEVEVSNNLLVAVEEPLPTAIAGNYGSIVVGNAIVGGAGAVTGPAPVNVFGNTVVSVLANAGLDGVVPTPGSPLRGKASVDVRRSPVRDMLGRRRPPLATAGAIQPAMVSGRPD